MWEPVFTRSTERIESPQDRRDVLRQLGRYCPLVEYDMTQAEVWQTTVVGWVDMRLVRIVIEVARERPVVIYGLYAKGDFRPLDRQGGVLRLAYEIDVVLSQSRLSVDDLVGSWIEYQDHAKMEEVLIPERIQAALPMWEWHHRNDFGAKVTELLDQMVLDTKYPAKSWPSASLRDSVLRFAELPFYVNWRLLEYAGFGPNDRLCRSYALCREEGDQVAILPLDGTSGPIHSANGMDGELILDTLERRAAYLRFFCWAIESGEGNFLLPRHRRELDFIGRLDHKVLALLDSDLAIEELGEDAEDESGQHGYAGIGEDRSFGRLKSLVVYGAAVFQAWFKLERNGEVVMVDDSSLANDLPLRQEKFGAPQLPVLKWPQDLKVIEPEEKSTVLGKNVMFYGHFFPDDRKVRTMSASVFMEELLAGRSSGGDVTELTRVSVQAHVQGMPRVVEIVDTKFTDGLELVNVEDGVSLYFKNCLFDKGIQGHLAKLGGNLFFEKCSMRAIPVDRVESCSIDLSDARIRGTLHLLDCHLTSSFNGGRIEVDGDLLVRGSFFGGRPETREPHWQVQELLETEDEMLMNGQALMPPDRATGLWDGTSVILNNAVIHGALELTVMDLDKRHIEGSRLRDLTWQTAMVCTVVRGGLMSDGCQAHHDVVLAGSVWAGDLNFTNVHCQGNLNGSLVVHDEARDLHRAIGFRVWNSDLKLTNARFDADLRLYGTDILADDNHLGFGELDLRGATIGGRLDLMGTRISADLDLDFCEVGDYVNAYFTDGWFSGYRLGLHVGKDISLSGAKMNSVELRGVRVGRMVRAVTGTFGRVLISMGMRPSDKEAKALIPVPSQVGAIDLRSVVFHGELHLVGIRIAYEERSQGALRRSQSKCGLILSGCTIGGDLLFFQEELKVALERRWSSKLENRPTWVNPDGVDGGRASVDDGQVRGTQSEPFRTIALQARIWGHLDLSGTVVGGHLDLRNIIVEGEVRLNDIYVKLDIRMDHGHNWKEKGIEDWSDPPRSMGSAMVAEKLRCDGDVLMTGLTLGSTQGQQTRVVLKAREAQVRGEWLFIPLNDGRGERANGSSSGTIALLYGGLDLAAAQINHLILGKANFDLGMGGATGERGGRPKVVDLERATINRFEIVKPMPSTVDLSRIKVGRWEFSANSATAEDYLEVLKEMDPFDRSVWVDVERSLRNEARDDDAHKVYRGMRREAARRRHLPSTRFQSNLRSSATNIIQAILWPFLIPFSLIVVVLLWSGALFSVVMNKFGLSSTSARLQFVEGCRSAVDRTFSRMERWVTAYGTQVWRPMVLWGIFFGFTLWLLSDPANVEIELGSRVMLVQGGRVVSTDPLYGLPVDSDALHEGQSHGSEPYPILLQLRRDELTVGDPWSLSDALFLAMRYHIPVLKLDIQSEWKAGQRELALGPLQFTPEKWAAVSQGYSFIAWSLLLIGLSVQVFRGKQG